MKRRNSWWNDPLYSDGTPRKFTGSVRKRAARSADLSIGSRTDPKWIVHFNAYVSGWIAANRIRFPQIRAEFAALRSKK